MVWLNRNRMKLVFVVMVAVIVLGGGNAKADFTMDAVRAEDLPNTGKGESFSNDGLRLYIGTSKLADGYGSYDIGVVERESLDAPWGEPVNLGPNINTSNMEGWPTVSPDDLELYFGRDDGTNWYPMRSTRASKDDPWGPAIEYTGIFPDDFSSDGLTKYTYWSGGYGGNDIWVTTRATIDDDWGEPVNLGPNVNNSNNQNNPSISSDGLALFFQDYSPYRLKMSIRSTKDDPWGPAIDVGSPVNGSWWIVFPEISPDGSTLYCNRGGGHGFTQVSIKPVVDLNSDGIVDVTDICIMVDHWGTDEQLCDIGSMPWGDGVVDVEDLIVLAEHLFEEIFPAELIGYWKLDEDEGDIAYNSVGDNHGILHGEPLWQPDGGQVAGALEFDGIDDYVITESVLNPSEGVFSVLAWVKGGVPGQIIVSQAGAANWLCTDLVEGFLMTELKTSGRGAPGPLLSQTSITDGNWHRIGLVWDCSNRYLYVDGAEVAADATALSGLESVEGGLYFGAGSTLAPDTFFSGLIDDVRLYNSTLSAEEIAKFIQ